MHPVRKAFNAWRADNPKGTVAEFASFLGYRSEDSVYRLMRGEYAPPIPQALKCAELLGWTVGRFINAAVAAQQRRAS
jgi:hypothetical protein